MNRATEIIVMAILLCGSLVSICWGPPAPPATPTTPISAPESLAITGALIAGYGLWKNRK